MKLLIVEDSKLITQRMQSRFNNIPEITSIDKVDNGLDALALFENFKPDLVILDISLPGKDGIELLKAFKNSNSGVKVFIFTNYPYEQYKKSCIEFGFH